MEKNALFSQLARWPLITFDHADIIGGNRGTIGNKASLYAYDFNENKAKLFICYIPEGSDIEAIKALYTAWIREFKKTS